MERVKSMWLCFLTALSFVQSIYIFTKKNNSTRYKLAKAKWSVGAEPPKWWIIDGHKHALNFCIFLCVNLANIHSWWCVRV